MRIFEIKFELNKIKTLDGVRKLQEGIGMKIDEVKAIFEFKKKKIYIKLNCIYDYCNINFSLLYGLFHYI